MIRGPFHPCFSEPQELTAISHIGAAVILGAVFMHRLLDRPQRLSQPELSGIRRQGASLNSQIAARSEQWAGDHRETQEGHGPDRRARGRNADRIHRQIDKARPERFAHRALSADGSWHARGLTHAAYRSTLPGELSP
ncbi:hypothetical protein GCM10009105_04920 [Dokdonella soli]|uniref:Uncharacterized protein n=1 Tax=Dokdonella soli TaxID=529810 RepID=A0ABN1ICF7_9GAMM